MRVPIPVVILLIFAVVSGIWWGNTRRMDFMTPPSSTALEQIRTRIESSLPRPVETDDAVPSPIEEPQAPPAPPEPPPKPPVDLGDLTSPPLLHDYKSRADLGADGLIELATELEKKGEFQRGLLAWERVMDSAKPDEAQSALAISAIQRLRPTLPDWNTNRQLAIQVTLHAGTGKRLAKTLTPILGEVARTLETSSAGIIHVKVKVTAGKTNTAANEPKPVALWFAGPDKKSPSTDVLAFTMDSPDSLRVEIYETLFLIIRGHLSRTATIRPPGALKAGEDPQQALHSRVTRLSWSSFATSLNSPPP